MALGWLWWRAWFPVDAVVAAAVCVAGVALGDIDVHSAWQARPVLHWAGSGGALGSQWTPLSPWLFVALGDMDVHLACGACRLATSTCILHGRRGTYNTGLALVARLVPSGRRCRRGCLRGRRGTYGTGLALVACLVPSGRRCRRGCLPGRRGTWRHRPSLCVASVALGDIDVYSVPGRRGTYGTRLALVARLVPSGCRCRLFAWQAWHLATPAFTLRGRCDIDVHSAWQAWHLRYWAGSGGALGSEWTPLSPQLFAWQPWHLATSTSTLRGRCGTWRHRHALCVAGAALGDIDLHFAWRAWHLAISTVTLCGRRGTWQHGLRI